MKNRSALITLAVLGGVLATSAAFAQIRWPIVFRNSDEMRPLGLMLIGWGAELRSKVSMFKHNCYHYGDGGNTISFTENFFNNFRNKGFSVNSLCLALQSPLAFDPQTGQRVPSYQVVHPRILAGRRPSDAGEVSEVLPIAPPDCFKRGLPYHDCTFDYDIRTGRAVSTAQKTVIAAARAAIDSMIANERAANGLRPDCSDVEPSERTNCSRGTMEMTFAGGREATSPYLALKGAGSIPDSARPAGVTLMDYSPALPLGYGYQLLTEGGAAPEGGDPAIARDPSRRASEEKIREVLTTISGR
jgi:hypothetical protein